MTLEQRLEDALRDLGMQRCASAVERFQTLTRGRLAGGRLAQMYRVEADEVLLLPLGDLHLGSTYSNRSLFMRFLNYIEETPNCYTVFLGDQIENATRTSVGMGLFEEDFHLPEQLDVLYEILRPLAQAGKIWGLHDGNHEYRTAAAVGLSPMRLLAQRLGVPYLGYQGYHLLRVRDQSYRIFTAHNRGSGRTLAGKVKAVDDVDRVAECDVYITGHAHILHHHTKPVFWIADDGTVVQRVRHYVICGSFLNYWGSYSEKELLMPSVQGAPLITFSGLTHNVRVTT
ncbi:MAG: hypothetical protein AB1330_01350 [Bacillota bacterium]